MMPAGDLPATSSPQGQGAQIAAGAMVGGRFRIEEPIAQDAVGRTYKAYDTAQGAPAAVRVIALRVLGANARALEVDVEKASAVIHKNLVSVLMIGREADFYFVATELMDGQSLREFMDAKRADGRGISVKGAYNLLSHIANGLEKAEDLMAHGGLNPASIWVNKAGRVKVSDLGLLRTLPALGRRGAPSGSPDHLYLAPEMIAGAPPSPVADVYSLGVILYEVLVGRPPSAPPTPVSQLAPEVPAAVDPIIERALSRSPQARWASPAAFKKALAGVLSPDAADAAAADGDARASQGTFASVEIPAAAVAAPNGAADRPNGAAAGPNGAAAASNGYPAAGGSSSGMPAQPPVMEGGRLTLGTPFNVAEVAGAVGDENQERWLVQKDKLDFGPFSLAQIRAQIERGEIQSEHLIVDSDSGERRKVKEFPGLGEFTKSAERRREQARRAHAEQTHETVEKRKSLVTIFIVGILVLGVLGGVAFYVLSRKASDGGKLASREEEAEVDAFLKDVKINFATAHVAKKGQASGPRHPGAGAANDSEFNNDMNIGDVTKAGGGDETLDDDVIQKVMMGNYRSLVPCIMAERHKTPGLSDISLDFVVRGTGKVSAVKVNGQRGGPFAGCVLGRMQSFGFPKFNGSKTIASWSMQMR